MTPQQYERLTELFHAALEIAPDERAAFLDQVCDGDADLQRELESLLAAHEQRAAYTEKPPDDIAAGMYLAQQDDSQQDNDAAEAAGAASLAPHTRIDRYEIRSLLAKGGMGEVYLAEDVRLHRKVALKILPAEVAANRDRMRRFEQEAQAAAALNHPNIAHIYEIGAAAGVNFIAMEFVDGVTLRAKIHSERTELRKLLKYLQQVAEGLSKAHAAGIVHRDLKPDNIMITRDDYAKILDFGLAKLVETERSLGLGGQSSSEVGTRIMAQQSLAGMVMGTAGYMSPEQAQGKVKEIDQRSDIFSFGCILFEAVTGHKPFEGKDLLDSLHKIVHAPTPLIKDTNANAPNELQRIVRRCLAKDPEERYQTIKDVALELKEVRQSMAGPAEIDTTVSPSGSTETLGRQTTEQSTASTSSAEYLVSKIKRHKSGVLIALVTLVIVIAALGYGLYRFVGQKKQAASFQTMKIKRLTSNGKVDGAAVSRDGKYVAYEVDDGGQQSLWIKQLAISAGDVQIVSSAVVRYFYVTFSPDGNYVYYAMQEKGSIAIYRVPVLGGPARKVVDAPSAPAAITFSPDGKQFAFLRNRHLMIADADGTGEKQLAPGRFWAASWSPDGKVIACVFNPRSIATLVEVRVADGTQRPISANQLEVIDRIAWLGDSSGLVLLGRERRVQSNQIWHVSYPDGEFRRITNDLSDYRNISVTADSNNLVTVQNEQSSKIWIAPNGDAGRARQITSGAAKERWSGAISWTPDGKIVYVSTTSGKQTIWITEPDGTGQRQLTDSSYDASHPAVSPDGRYLLFTSDRAGPASIWRTDINGTNPKRLTDGGNDLMPYCSPDGKWVIYFSKQNLWKVPIDGGASVQLTHVPMARGGIVSPDGKLIACWYLKPNHQYDLKIAIIPFEGGEPIKTFDLQPTAIGSLSNYLRWTSDSRAVLYLETRGGVSNIWMQPLDGSPPKQVTDFKSDRIFGFDWSRDGKQLALARGTETSDVVLISNFKE